MASKKNAEINKSAERIVSSFMNTNTPAGKDVLKQAKTLLKEGKLSEGKIRGKLVENRTRIL